MLLALIQLVGVMVLALCGVVLGAWLYLRRSLPKLSGRLAVEGLDAPIEILRDVDAVPHIYAGSERDALFGLGYVHAQERLGQMEFQRRLGSGTLAALVGRRVLPFDRFFRTLGLRAAAASAFAALDAPTRAQVEAYVAGINAFIAGCSRSRLPPEFTLLRARPAAWSGDDVLVCAKLMAWNLGGTYALDLLRADLIARLGAERASRLMPDTCGDPAHGGAEQRSTPDPRAEPLSAALRGVHAPAEALGSNHWILAGGRTPSGLPLLASDPHLASTLPSPWYLAHVSGGALDAIGATLPGLPAVVMGRNRHIAWAVTNVNPDAQDLYRERLDEAGERAEHRGRFEPLRVRLETIEVRGGPSVAWRVRATRHGPLLSDVLNANGERQPEARRPPRREPLALRYTALGDQDGTLASLLALGRARDRREFEQALRGYVAPGVNIGYADAEGHISNLVAGHVPLRAGGDGALPLEGWSGADEWRGVIPFEELPRVWDPPAGVIVSANTRVLPAGYRHDLGRDFVEPHRRRRIDEVLAARARPTLHEHAALQGDTLSLQARALAPLLLALVGHGADAREEQALGWLRAWDGDMRPSSAAALVFAAWLRHLGEGLLRAELGSLWRAYEPWVSYLDRFLTRALREAVAADPAHDAGLRAAARQALRRALDDLERRLGRDRRRWRWGRVHRAVFTHPLFDGAPLVGRLWRRSVESGGDWSSVNVGGSGGSARPYEQRYVAGYRQLVDLSDLDAGRFILAIGQSGHFLSPHYDDYLADWSALRYRPMRLRRATVEAAGRHALRLLPRAPSTNTAGRRPRGGPMDAVATPPQELVNRFVTAAHGDFKQVKELLQAHPGLVNAPSSEGETAIQAAAHTGQKAIVRWLLEAGAPLDICAAALLGLADEVAVRLERDPSQAAATGAHGLPVMVYAAMGGDLEVAERLHARGARLDLGEGLNTPLHGAALFDHAPMVNWLVARGASLDAKDYGGRTPLEVAQRFKRAQAAEALAAAESLRATA